MTSPAPAAVALCILALGSWPPAAVAQVSPSDRQAGAGPVELLFDNARRTVECGDQGLAVLGSRNVLTLAGRCPLVKVSGDDNMVLIDDTDAIVVTGDRNQVSWRSARPPTVSNTGRQNRVGPQP